LLSDVVGETDVEGNPMETDTAVDIEVIGKTSLKGPDLQKHSASIDIDQGREDKDEGPGTKDS
jgi:hypothetical protein